MKILVSLFSILSDKRGGGAKFAKSLNVEVGMNLEGRILWKNLMHNSNLRGVNKRGGWIFICEW